MPIGRDRGEKHSMALSCLAAGNMAAMGENHTVPVLRQIVNKEMTFAVFPLMSTVFDYPYYCFSEVLDAVEQILGVPKFLSLTWSGCRQLSIIHHIRYSTGH